MNERLPYEESVKQKLQEIPLPEMEPSWQKMKALLKEKEDDRIIPPFFTGCAVIGLAVLLLVAGIWLYKKQNAAQEKTASSAMVSTKTSTGKISGNNNTSPTGTTFGNTSGSSEEKVDSAFIHSNISPKIASENDTDSNKRNNAFVNNTKIKTASSKLNEELPKKIKNNSTDIESGNSIYKKKKTKYRSAGKTQMNVSATGSSGEKKNKIQHKRSPFKKTTAAKTAMQVYVDEQKTDSVITPYNDSTVLVKTDSSFIPVDSIPVKTDTAKVADTTKEASAKKEKKKSKYYFAAGLSLQHQLPVNGQKSNNYDAYGRKNSIKDYIPAPYIRFYKENKWFINTGFRYGAPQAVKETKYSSSTSLDTSQGQILVNRSSYIVRKTFYHQVPLSFNVFVTPKLSVGAGLMYSVFNGALSERTTTQSVFRGGVDSVISTVKELVKIPVSGDSFFTRTQFNFTVQAEFHWKRFGFGAQYTKGLQPYLKYEEAGVIKKLKNESFQLFIRYELWKQKKK